MQKYIFIKNQALYLKNFTPQTNFLHPKYDKLYTSGENREMNKYLNQILLGDCLELMRGIPDGSVDAVFADPPYNLQLGAKTLYRPEDQTAARAVRDEWDSFASNAEYDEFTRAWLAECKRVLKPNGAMWTIDRKSVV